jgi:hypothetical protein
MYKFNILMVYYNFNLSYFEIFQLFNLAKIKS